MTSACLFCSRELAPGSDEHVFLSALGGRLITRNATCTTCNNDFARSEFGKVDDALAEAFQVVRSALMIRTGRDKPPPTIQRAGRIPDGPEYDLAPGFVPIPRAAEIPDFEKAANEPLLVVARDTKDAKRIVEIAKRRGLSPTLRTAERVATKVPWTTLSFTFDGTRVWRAAAKTALLGSCVLYGNQAVRSHTPERLREAVKIGVPEVSEYAGWDYVNPWPTVVASVPHRHNAGGSPSPFDHSLIVADVGAAWVGYVEFFGAFRFSVRLGDATGLPARGISLNPRVPARFELSVDSPTSYQPRHTNSFQEEGGVTRQGMGRSMEKVLSVWHQEDVHRHIDTQTQKLLERIANAGADEAARDAILSDWVQEIAQLEMGNAWRTKLDKTFVDDEPA